MQDTQLVLMHQEKVTTTSMKVAEIFGKEHYNVLRDIENLECSPEFTALNFEVSEYKGRNGMNKFYFITRDGFSFLAMGYTGSKAARFKEEFIGAFNRMENALRKATTPTLLAVYQQRMLSEPTKSCLDDRWNIFDQAGEVMFWIEKYVGCVNEYDLADGSIGIHWAKFREGKPWAKPVTQYYHEFKDVRGNRLSNCFDYEELKHFKKWLKKTYMTEHLYPYLFNKFKKDKLMLPRVEQVKPKLLSKGKAA